MAEEFTITLTTREQNTDEALNSLLWWCEREYGRTFKCVNEWCGADVYLLEGKHFPFGEFLDFFDTIKWQEHTVLVAAREYGLIWVRDCKPTPPSRPNTVEVVLVERVDGWTIVPGGVKV